MKQLRTGILCGVLLALCLLTGCTQQPEPAPENPVVVGFSQLGSESAWRIANTQSMEAAAQKFGYGLMMDNANQKQEKQIAAIRSFIAYRVDVIIFSPIVETGWTHVLREAKNAGIPVILTDRMIESGDEDLYTSYVGADFIQEGRKAGEYLVRKADALGRTTVNVVEISGTIDSTPMRERHQGFMDVIRKDPRFHVVDSISGDFLRSKGKECMAELLRRHGAEGIDVVYSHNDAMTLGALDVLDAQGIRPGQDMVIISVDGEKAAVDALRQGRINCIVQCTPDLGEATMSLVQDLVAGRQVPKVAHPEESMFTDFDDLTSPQVEGF